MKVKIGNWKFKSEVLFETYPITMTSTIGRLNSEKSSFVLEYFYGIKTHQQNQKITVNPMM